MKKCPYCAEEIQDEAVICRFCSLDLKTGKLIGTKDDSKEKTKISVNDGVRIGIGMFFKLPLIIIGVIIALIGGLFIGTYFGQNSLPPILKAVCAILLIFLIMFVWFLLTRKK